jgi:hypothetical protein
MTLWPSFTKEVSVESYISIALLCFESFTQLRSVRLPSYDTAILALDQITFRGNQFEDIPCWCGCELPPQASSPISRRFLVRKICKREIRIVQGSAINGSAASGKARHFRRSLDFRSIQHPDRTSNPENASIMPLRS